MSAVEIPMSRILKAPKILTVLAQKITNMIAHYINGKFAQKQNRKGKFMTRAVITAQQGALQS